MLPPAKINLCLHVLGKRPDGYHELAMLMQRVSLYDRVSLTLTDDGAIRVRCAGLTLAAGEENIAARAARRAAEWTRSRADNRPYLAAPLVYLLLFAAAGGARWLGACVAT